MLPKAGKSQRRPEGYRPITLLSALAKFFEKLFLPLLQSDMHPRSEKFGEQALNHAAGGQSDTLRRSSGQSKEEYDIARVFDRVWYQGLLHKMFRAGTPITRLQRSSIHSITAGVFQGSILSPTLYALYTEDIPMQQDTMLALYADDIALEVSELLFLTWDSSGHIQTKMQMFLLYSISIDIDSY